MARFTYRPSVEREIARSPATKAALRSRARLAARESERIGRQVADSYAVTVDDTIDGVRLEANTDGINAASWIEFGTEKLPASAPLRRGTEAAGLKFKRR